MTMVMGRVRYVQKRQGTATDRSIARIGGGGPQYVFYTQNDKITSIEGNGHLDLG